LKYFFTLYEFQKLLLTRAQLNMTIKNNFYSNKTPYTQFFCDKNNGMKLRSGTVINYIKNTPFYNDWMDLYENISLRPAHNDEIDEAATNYCGECFAIINRIRFIEKHHESLRNDPNLSNMYRNELNDINSTILKIESGEITCGCWQYFGWRITFGECMLTPEYNHLASLDHSDYHATKNTNVTHPDFFKNRHLYRLYCNNFISPTEEIDTNGDSVKKHDYNLILKELKNWQLYFRREHASRIKAATKTLKTVTIDDCVGKILEFL